MQNIWISIFILSATAINNWPVHGQLYNESDPIIQYTSATVMEHVYEKPYATLIEYYSSTCGDCIGYAPTFKAVARDLLRWHQVVRVAVLNCFSWENKAFCRDNDIQWVPQLRYAFGRYEDVKLGKNVTKLDKGRITQYPKQVLEFLQKEPAPPAAWPMLTPLDGAANIDHFIGNLPKSKRYVFFIFVPSNNWKGIASAIDIAHYAQLDLSGIDSILVYVVSSKQVADVLNIPQSGNKPTLSYLKISAPNNFKKLKLPTYSRLSIRKTVMKELKRLHVKIPEWIQKHRLPHSSVLPLPDRDTMPPAIRKAIVRDVLSRPPVLYLEDYDTSLRLALFNEIPRHREISGEKLAALKDFIRAVKHYQINQNAKFIDALDQYVQGIENSVMGSEYERRILGIAKEYGQKVNTTGYYGCVGSSNIYRGYTCGLWQVFHSLLANAVVKPAADDYEGNQALRAIHGYVKYFMGCIKCSRHFQQMAERRKLFDAKGSVESMLWLWEAHNEVNQRLAKDDSEDPKFPKIVYPSKAACSECHLEHKGSEVNWNKDIIKNYLVDVYVKKAHYGTYKRGFKPPTIRHRRGRTMSIVGNREVYSMTTRDSSLQDVD